MSNVARVIDPIVNLFQRIYREYEDDNKSVQIALVLDKTNGVYCIAHRNGDSDGYEQFFVASLEDIRFLQEEIVLATKKFAILFPMISIKICRSEDNQPIFSTYGKTLQEKVAEFHNILLRDIFVVKANHEDCEIEICFFIARSGKAEDKTQLIFTTNYFNPVATENLVLKLLDAEARHESIELVGFVGKFSDDNQTRVERAVDIGFEVFIKRVEETARNLRHVEDIESFRSVLVEPMQRKSGPIPVTKPSSERWNLRTRVNPSIVDLTSEEEKESVAYVLTDEISSSSLFEYACSEIQEEPLLDDFYDVNYKCLIEKWDQQVDKKQFQRPPFNCEFFDHWILELENFKHHNYFEDGFMDVMTRSRTPPPAKLRLIPDEGSQGIAPAEPEMQKSPDISAIDYYQQKASGSSSSQRRTIPITKPQLGRGLDQNQSVELDVKPRRIKSTLFTETEMEKMQTKKRKDSSIPNPSIVSSLFEKTNKLLQDYKIPKLQHATQEQSRSSSSVLQTITQRRPIHANTPSPFLDKKDSIFSNRTSKMLQLVKFPKASSSHTPDTRAPEIPKFSSKNAADDDDVIFVDEATENEPNKNDQNNNQQFAKRRCLFNIETVPEEKEYKFFKSKQKPHFNCFDGKQK